MTTVMGTSYQPSSLSSSHALIVVTLIRWQAPGDLRTARYLRRALGASLPPCRLPPATVTDRLHNESEVEAQLRALSDAGATDYLASIFPEGDDSAASFDRTRALLKGLVGKL